MLLANTVAAARAQAGGGLRGPEAGFPDGPAPS
jgi:hypothetical protein